MTAGLQDIRPSPSDPETISALLRKGEARGLCFSVSDDFTELARRRHALRGEPVSPLFDPAALSEPAGRGFWMAAVDAGRNTVGLQAFRLDVAEPSLARWAPRWMLRQYAERGERVLPCADAPAPQSSGHLVSGRVAYHGELWIDRRAKGCFPLFPRLGLLLAWVTWQPEAVWALTGRSMAMRGHMRRMGYGHVEPGFLTWEQPPRGAERSEWLGLAQRHHLEAAFATEAGYRPSPVP